MIDAIVEREKLRSTLAHLLAIHVSATSCLDIDPGESSLLVDYASVCENLEHNTATYNTVTYGMLGAEGPMFAQIAARRPRLGKALADLAGHLERTRTHTISPKRLKRALASGGFDAEGGGSLEGLSGLARGAAGADANRAWRSVQLARNTHRPTAQAYIDRFVDGFIACTATACLVTTVPSCAASVGLVDERLL